MKITSVELHPANSSLVHVLSFRDPQRQNPYNVKNIGGLDAEDIVPKFYGISEASNERLYDITLEKRELIIRVELNPRFSEGKTYSDLRDDLYKTIASSRTGLIQVQFKNGTDVVAAISGLLRKFEATHFEKNPEVQITIQANDPMLTALDPVAVDVLGLDPALTNIQDLLSTAPHGFSFVLGITGDFATLTISDPNDSSWQFQVSPTGGFLNGDSLHFSSERNNKQLYIQRGPSKIPIADKLALNSIWPVLFPGDNNFSLSNPTKVSWTSISHYPTYWGV